MMKLGEITLAVVDDHKLFREGLVGLLRKSSVSFRVLWEASDGLAFLDNLNSDLPDVVLMDISMPGMDGIEATRRAIALYPGIRIIALSMYGEQEYYLKMIQAGAKGFLRKDSDIDEVSRTIIRVMEGENCFSQEMLYALVTQPPVVKDDILSERETEVLELICAGLPAGEIAEKLFLSKRTVEKHRANILEKSHCRNTANLVAWALKNNYVKP
jgi:DNA-binding NarL/FixJ family response regulator